MTSDVREIGGRRVLVCATGGPPIQTANDALDLIGAASVADAHAILVPAASLDTRFFQLANGFAGEFVQKLVNYGLRMFVVGDISAALSESRSLRDFVRESNRGRQIWFLSSEAELAARLDRAGREVR